MGLSVLIDIGNTRSKWRVWDGHRLQAGGACRTPDFTPERLPASPAPSQAVLASVGDPQRLHELAALLQASGLTVRLARTQADLHGVRVAYAEPARLGVDRWLAMLGAVTLDALPCCIVDAGTAVTVDAIDASGRHLGGVILPGSRLMRAALYGHTRRIPDEADGQTVWLADNTRDAVWSGCLHAVAGGIERLLGQHLPLLGTTARVLLTGGDAAALQPHLAVSCQRDDDLVFRGMTVLADAD